MLNDQALQQAIPATVVNAAAAVGTGNSAASTHGGLTTSLFAGYGSYMTHNIFHNMKRIGIFQSDVNNVDFTGNTVAADCGFSTGGALEFNPATQSTANNFAGNLIEITNGFTQFSDVEHICKLMTCNLQTLEFSAPVPKAEEKKK